MKLEIGKTYTLKNDTKARCKVLGEVTGCHSPKRYWVELVPPKQTIDRAYWVHHVAQYLECGLHAYSVQKEAWELIEIPPEPCKVSRWLHMFSDASGVATMGISNNKEIQTFGSVKLIGRKKITLTEGEFDE